MNDRFELIAPRRQFLAGLAALGAGAILPGCQTAGGGAAGGKPNRIDVHHHIAPPAYSAALKSMMRGHARWSIQASLEDMDKSGIATSVTSLINPGMNALLGGDAAAARKIARESNEYAAKLARDHPGRFGVFATIPLPDVEGCLREIEYALDSLRADGFLLMTSYGKQYLGDRAFWPVLEELNRRKAVVYTHPPDPACCINLVPDVPTGVIELAVDSTRSMASLLFGGAITRYPDIRWIWSHSGGVTPFLLTRFLRQESIMKDRQEKLPNGVTRELTKFYYDMAQGNHPGALDGLRRIAPVSQYLYGTDFPFRDGAEVNDGLAKYGFSAAEISAINRDNALRLLPQLKV